MVTSTVNVTLGTCCSHHIWAFICCARCIWCVKINFWQYFYQWQPGYDMLFLNQGKNYMHTLHALMTRFFYLSQTLQPKRRLRPSHNIVCSKISHKRNSRILSRLYQAFFMFSWIWVDLLTISFWIVVWLKIKSAAGTFPYKAPTSINDCANLSSSLCSTKR